MLYSQIGVKLLKLSFCLAFVGFAWSQPSGPAHLQKGVDDVRARIAKNTQIAETLRDSVSEHVAKLAEIIYGIYGQEDDPARTLIELKDAIDSVHSAVENGVTGQVWPAVSQFGQAALDYGVDTAKAFDPKLLYPILKSINAIQQVALEAARLKATMIDRDAYDAQIKSDQAILQRLQDEAANITKQEPQPSADESDNPQPPPPLLVHPPAVDLSAMDNFILMEGWLDQGNRTFNSHIQRAQFFKDFPALKQFDKLVGSPRSEADAAGLGNLDFPSAPPTAFPGTTDDSFETQLQTLRNQLSEKLANHGRCLDVAQNCMQACGAAHASWRCWGNCDNCGDAGAEVNRAQQAIIDFYATHQR